MTCLLDLTEAQQRTAGLFGGLTVAERLKIVQALAEKTSNIVSDEAHQNSEQSPDSIAFTTPSRRP